MEALDPYISKKFAERCLENFSKAYPGVVEHYKKAEAAEKAKAAAHSKHPRGKASKHSKNIDDSLYLSARS